MSDHPSLAPVAFSDTVTPKKSHISRCLILELKDIQTDIRTDHIVRIILTKIHKKWSNWTSLKLKDTLVGES